MLNDALFTGTVYERGVQASSLRKQCHFSGQRCYRARSHRHDGNTQRRTQRTALSSSAGESGGLPMDSRLQH